LLSLAKTTPIQQTYKVFLEGIEQLRKRLIDNFVNDLASELSYEIESPVIRTYKAELQMAMKSTVAENQFAIRKNLEEANETLKNQKNLVWNP